MVQYALMDILLPCDNWKALYFIQICFYEEVFCNRRVAAFFETTILKEVCVLRPIPPH